MGLDPCIPLTSAVSISLAEPSCKATSSTSESSGTSDVACASIATKGGTCAICTLSTQRSTSHSITRVGVQNKPPGDITMGVQVRNNHGKVERGLVDTPRSGSTVASESDTGDDACLRCLLHHLHALPPYHCSDSGWESDGSDEKGLSSIGVASIESRQDLAGVQCEVHTTSYSQKRLHSRWAGDHRLEVCCRIERERALNSSTYCIQHKHEHTILIVDLIHGPIADCSGPSPQGLCV